MNRISMLALVLVVAGCIYVPPVWDAGDEIYRLDFIEPGVTTKDQVLGRLGEPDTRSEAPGVSSFIYQGKTVDQVFIVGVTPVGGVETDWWVMIEFDENDVVSQVSIS